MVYGISGIVMQKPKGSGFNRSDSLLKATARVNHTLLLDDSISTGVYKALSIIGKSTNVDRVYVFENYIDKELNKYFCNQRIEWTKDSIEPQINNEELQDFPMSDLTPRWVEEMLKGNAIKGIVRTFPETERSILEPQDIISILVVPIVIRDHFWGFVGFDNCTSEYEWSITEVEVLKSLASNIGLAFERIKTQNELKESKKRLQESLESEKEINELKDRFIAMISHEIRTPITAIVSSLDLLDSYSDRLTPEKKKQIYSRMLNGSGRIIELVEEVLLMGKAQSGNMDAEYSETDMKALIRKIAEVHKNGSLNEHKVDVSVDLKQDRTITDTRLVTHIFDNLLSNAAKYSPKGSVVSVCVEEVGEEVHFSVSDQGIGIGEDEIDRIFEPFYRSRKVFDIAGTGLGLTIVKGSVETLGGTVAVHSETGKGTSFVIKIPSRTTDDLIPHAE